MKASFNNAQHLYKYFRPFLCRQRRFSLLWLTLFLLGHAISATIFAQGKVITISYGEIVDSSPITHSGMNVKQVIDYINEAKSSQLGTTQLQEWRQQVNKLAQEYQSRRQKTVATKNRLNQMLAQGQISLAEAQQKYNQWAAYTAEAQAQYQMAKEILDVLVQKSANQNEVLKNLQAQVEPFLEPYAFLLEDALETATPDKIKPDLIDLGELFPEGEAQPAWADLVRTRRYFVLSDGKGYARIFSPGETGQSAYEQNYKVLRQVLGWLWDSTKTEWTIDVYAYQNDLTTQTLKLNSAPYSVKVNSFPAPPTGVAPLDLQAIKEFLDKKLILEGAYINDEGTLVLYGSKGSTEPTLEGQPIELSDLAVAYRSVFYAGHGDAYISLDRSPYPEQVNVNFGGRMADTRMGWVVLRSDMRFKTLSDEFDPVTGDSLSKKIRETMPDFKTQAERTFSRPESELPEEEYTRYWFSPDSSRLIVSTSPNGKLMKISSARFTGNAVREDPALGNIVVSNETTPAWTRDTLAHLNNNYERYANMFSELRELDNVGRLLALFTWLKQQKTKPDLDSLLNVELVKCSTPRRKPQMLIGYSFEHGQVTATNLSQLAEAWANKRPRGNNASTLVPSTMMEIQSEMLSALSANLSNDNLNEEKSQMPAAAINKYTVIGGGIDLNLTKTVARPKRLPPSDVSIVQRLKQSPTGEVKVSPTKTVSRALVKPVEQIEQPRLSGIRHTIGEPQPDPAFGATATTRDVAGTNEEVTTVNTSAEKLKLSRRGSKNPLSEDNSRIAYYGEDKAPVAFVRYEKGTALTYKFSASNGTLTAEKTARTSVSDEAALINRSVQRGEPTSQAWKNLSENTNVLAFDKSANNETLILTRENGGYSLTRYNEQGSKLSSLEGDQALAEMNNSSRLRVANGSTDNTVFVHGSQEGDKFILMVGKRRQEIPVTEIQELMSNPSRAKHSVVDDLFGAPGAEQKEFVIYRDALSRRPTRFGGSITEGGVADPVELASLLRQRYPGARIVLDDEIEVAKQNLASIQLIKHPSEVGLLIPEKSFEIKDFGLIKRIKGNLGGSGVVLIETPQQMQPIPNILIVAGHNDAKLVDYLTSLGEQGLLQDKVLLLNTCYAEGNPNLFHDLIQKYHPKAVFLHTEKISDVALDPVLKNLGQMLHEMESKGEAVHPIDLFEKAINRTLASPTLREAQRFEIRKLRSSFLQVSYVAPVAERTTG